MRDYDEQPKNTFRRKEPDNRRSARNRKGYLYLISKIRSESHFVSFVVIEKGAGNVNRLQRLKEWQEKRNAIREQEKKKQVKPFYAGSTNMGQANKPSLTISTTVSNKPVTRLQIKNAASKLSTAQHQQKPTAQGNTAKLE